ncbi:IS3 family transposase [Sebaldella sp. S0638]|uniref:IS3 family transposase n=1 Tax=Sebaldella sp. S0638 TaxID=2957809 RepID=UPI003531AE8B|nr:IS3 family transposase [Sebaldella sp. S0638]
MEIKKEFLKGKKRYGAPKIKNRLEHRGVIIGINRVRRLMREEGLIPIVLKKYRYEFSNVSFRKNSSKTFKGKYSTYR